MAVEIVDSVSSSLETVDSLPLPELPSTPKPPTTAAKSVRARAVKYRPKTSVDSGSKSSASFAPLSTSRSTLTPRPPALPRPPKTAPERKSSTANNVSTSRKFASDSAIDKLPPLPLSNRSQSQQIWSSWTNLMTTSGARYTKYYHKFTGVVNPNKPNSKKREMSAIEKEIIAKIGLDLHPSNRDGILYMPMNYNSGARAIVDLKDDPFKIVYGVENMDKMVSKKQLWLTLYNAYGDRAARFVPYTYVIEPRIRRVLAELPPNDLYVLKKDVQRQKGLQVMRVCEIQALPWNELNQYLIVQKFLKDPMLVKSRKINLRVYVLVVMRRRPPKYEVFIYDDGFMYYTPKPYNASTNAEETITTGYIDRQVYVENPLTRKELYKQFEPTFAEKFEKGVKDALAGVMKPYGRVFRNRFAVSFQLFGADVQPNADGTFTVIELNKSPDMHPKDERDGKLKRGLQWDAWEKALQNTAISFERPDAEARPNGFVKIV